MRPIDSDYDRSAIQAATAAQAALAAMQEWCGDLHDWVPATDATPQRDTMRAWFIGAPDPAPGARNPMTEAEMTMTMACRAISRRQAEYIGGAAAMAGGYVAVDGPRVERIDRDAYRAIVEDATHDAVRWRREDARRLAAAYHELPSGDYVRIVSPGGYHDHLILVIPPDYPLAEYGYALPPSVVRDLIPLLEAAGYDTAGVLGETSGEGAEVV